MIKLWNTSFLGSLCRGPSSHGAASNKHDEGEGGWVFSICCCKYALWPFFENLRDTHLGYGLSFENPKRIFEFNGEEKLGDTKDESFDVDEGLLRVQRGNAP